MANNSMLSCEKMEENIGLLQHVRSQKHRKFSHKYDMVKNGTHVHGWVTHVDHPFHFYVQFNDWNTQQYVYLMSELQTEAPYFQSVDNPQVGSPYVAFFKGKWFRVLLELLVSETQAQVFFVDVGDRQIFDLSELREIEDRFLSLAVQASLCQLGCITVTKQNNKTTVWPEESCQYFKDMMEINSYVNVFVVGCYVGEVGCIHKKESKLYVTAYGENEELSFNKKLTDAGHGFSVQKHEETWHKALRVAPRPPVLPVQTVKSDGADRETEARRQTSSNSAVEVSVVHAVDPSRFYVRNQSTEKYLLKHRLLINICPNLEQPQNVETGKVYGVLDTQTQLWYRGSCLKKLDVTTITAEAIYDFFLIDEGFNLQVPLSCIKQLSEKLKSYRPLVWECFLDVKAPKHGWPRAVVDHFKRLVDRDRLEMTVVGIVDGLRKVDLSQIPSRPGESVVKSVRDAVADLLAESSIPPAVPPKPVARKFFTNLNGIKKGSRLEGRVVQVNDPDAFYVQFQESDGQKFCLFDSQMQDEYNQAGAKSLHQVGVPQRGFPYVVLYKGTWNRCLVEDIGADGTLTAFLVDAGLRSTVSSDALLQITDKFIAHPVQATLCKLYGVCTKNPSGLWSVESKFHFKKLVNQVQVTAFVEGLVPGGIGRTTEDEFLLSVVMYVGDDCASLNTRFTRSGHGISVRQHDLTSHNRVRNEPVKESADRTLCDPESPKSSVKIRLTTPQNCVYDMSAEQVSPVGFATDSPQKRRKISMESCVSDMSCSHLTASPETYRPFCSSAVSYGDLSDEGSVQSVSVHSDCSAEVAALESIKISGVMPQEGDYVMGVRFLMCQAPDSIYVRPIPYESKYEELRVNMKQSYQSCRVGRIRNLEVGVRCAAYVYGQWIRAVVLDFNESLQSLIHNMDTGESHRVSIEQIFPLIEPFQSMPKLAIRCSLAGIDPTSALCQPDLAAKITSWLLAADEIFISCKQRPKTIPSVMSVNIVYGKTHSNGKTLVNLNDKILQAKYQMVSFSTNGNDETKTSNFDGYCAQR